MQCPACHSDQSQRLQVIFERGTQNIQLFSSTGGLAPGGGVAEGFTSTTGTSQSLLAQRCAPPRKKSKILWIILGLWGPGLVYVGLVKGEASTALVGLAMFAVGFFSFGVY
jgi:hypothetical protein